MSSTLDRIWRHATRRAPCAVVLLFLSLASGAAAQDPPPTASTTVPFVRAFGLVFVELAWSGAPRLALLDTGANASAIDPRVSRHLAVLRTTEVVGTTGSLAAEVVLVSDLRLGELALPDLHATRRDLAGLLAPDGRKVDLILGSDAFLELALTLDFHRSRLEAGAATHRDDAHSVPMLLDHGIPTLPARLGDLAVVLRIDTGASLFETEDVYVNVPTSTWDALRERTPELSPTSHLQGTGADGKTVELPVARLARVRIGPLDLESVFVIVQPPEGYFASPAAVGFVGNNYLEKLGRVTLDFRAGRFRAP